MLLKDFIVYWKDRGDWSAGGIISQTPHQRLGHIQVYSDVQVVDENTQKLPYFDQNIDEF